MEQPRPSPQQRTRPQLIRPGFGPVEGRPGFWPLFAAAVVSGLLALLAWSIMFGGILLLLLSDQISNFRDLTTADVGEAALEFLLAAGVAGVASVFILAGLLKAFTRVFTQHRVRYGHALATGGAALMMGAAGGVFDLLLLGLTFGIFALASFAAAAAWLLQRFARPAPDG